MVHFQHVEAVLTSLREHQLLAKGSKCEFMRREAEFLVFMVSDDGVRPLTSKIEAVLQIPEPETISHLRSFLGMCNFFRTHIPAYAEISAPLTDLLKSSKHGRQRLAWSLSSNRAFEHLKDFLTTAPLLRHFDPKLRTVVHIDASQQSVGAVLLQWKEGEVEPRPLCFLSRKLQGAQLNYDARNAEALAAQVALAAWRPLLYGVQFDLVSDHASLRHDVQQQFTGTSFTVAQAITTQIRKHHGLFREEQLRSTHTVRTISAMPVETLQARHQTLNISYFLDGTAAEDEVLMSRRLRQRESYVCASF